jgi:hypothetical protein
MPYSGAFEMSLTSLSYDRDMMHPMDDDAVNDAGPIPIPQAKFRIGLLEGLILGFGPDFFEPMGEAEINLWEGG